MNILITGGTGFIGTSLCAVLLHRGHHLTVYSRHPEQVAELCGKPVLAVRLLDDLTTEDQFDAIINLAGEGIADARWTAARKKQLLDSRIATTEQLVDFIERVRNKPKVLISGSAVGFYGNQADTVLDENSPPHDDFAHRLCAQWEQAARGAEASGVRVCILRTGLVIGSDGGFLQRMLPAFRFGLGGTLGDGRQWMSWIHKRDLLAIITLLLDDENLQGVFNGTAPAPVNNRDFTRCLAKLLHRPALLPVPAPVLKIMLGEMSELLLGGQRVIPGRLLEMNFPFQFPTLESALQDVL